VERAAPLPASLLGLARAGDGQRAVSIDRDECPQAVVQTGDAVEAVPRGLDR
jgi:hypothetical protein